MKKMFSRIICMILCCLMCFGVLISCKNGDENKGDSTINEGTNSDAAAFSTVSKQDYDEYEFRIVYFAGVDGLEKDFLAEKLNGEILNDRVYEKNLLVTDTYNISLKFDTMINDELPAYIRNNSMTGDSPYDVYGINRSAMSLCYEGCFLDLTTLEDIDTTQEWWDQKWVSAMNIHGSLFSLVGDFSIGSLQSLSCLCFNKNLFTDLGLAYPYDLVKSGDWTYDKMLEYVKDATRDVDENQKYDTEDFYGITGWETEAGYNLFYSSGFTFAKTNSAGELEISYDSNKLTDIYSYVYRIWKAENNYLKSGDASVHSYPWDIFKKDGSLFLDTTLLKIGLFLSDMESEYGLIPSPKFNKDQADYSSYSSYTIPMTCVPVNVSDAQRTGNIIEAFCTASYDVVTPDIFEIVTKLQNVSDPESSDMVDIIIRTKMFDPAHWYVISGYHDLSRLLLRNDSTNITSHLKGYARPAPAEVENINKLYKASKDKYNK